MSETFWGDPAFSIPEAEMVDSLTPNDPRVEHKFAQIGGFKYHYMLAKPVGKPTATILLCHGWPDLGMGWRNQVPFLVSLNLQVIVPDMLGYGQTDAPHSAEEFSMKKMASDMVQLVKEVTPEPIILGGHDWGGAFVWRMARFHPELIRGVFSICVPYIPPSPVQVALPEMVKQLPNFTYQLQLAGGGTEEIIAKAPERRIRGFLNGLYHGLTPDGKPVFSTAVGLIEERVDNVSQSPLMSKEMTDFYVQEYSRNGLHSPCNWYRTRPINADDEIQMAKENFKFPMPAMLLMADRDAALPLSLAEGQEKYFAAGLKIETIKDCSHWAMIQRPAEVNEHIREFLKSLFGNDLKASL